MDNYTGRKFERWMNKQMEGWEDGWINVLEIKNFLAFLSPSVHFLVN